MISASVTRAFLRSLSRRKSLNLLQLLGIAFGVAAVIGMALSSESALRSFSRAVEFLGGRSTHRLERLAGPMDERRLRALAGDPAVEAWAPVLERRVLLAGGPPVRVLGIDPFLDRAVRPGLAPDAAAPGSREAALAFLTRPNAVLLEAGLARGLGTTAGGTLETIRGPLKVIGTFPNPSGEPLVVMDIAHAQRFFGVAGRVDYVDLLLSDPEGFARRWQLGYRLRSHRERLEGLEALIGSFRLNLEALSLMALFVSAFLIYNTAMFSVVSRRRDAGILRCLGARRSEVAFAFLAESAAFGILGGLLGGALGYALARGLTDVVGGTISSLYFFLRPTGASWSWHIPAAGATVGLAASLLGSALPLVELCRTEPVAALRGRSAGRGGRAASGLLALGGAAIVLLSAALLAAFPEHIHLGFLGVFGILFGLSLPTGAVLLLAGPGLRRALGRVAGTPGRLAAGNVVRHLDRTAVAAAAFMVALSLVIGLGSMIGSFRESLVRWMGSQLRGDLYLSNATDMEIPPAVYGEVLAIPGIGGVDAYRKVAVAFRGRTVHVAAVRADVLHRYARFDWVSGGDEHWEAVERGDAIVSESFARLFGVSPGDTIVLEGASGPETLRIEAVFYDYSTEHGLVMMDRRRYVSLYGDRTINSLAVFIDPAEPRRQEILDRVRALARTHGLPAASREEFHRNILAVFDSTFAVTRSMRVLAILIAFFGIAGALLTLFIERRRDYGILRALGVSPAQVASMTLLEALAMAAVSFTLSAGVGSVLSFLLIRVINLRSFHWTIFYHPDWTPYALAAAVALCAGAGAALYPLWKVKRLYPQMQIREE